MRLFKIDAGDDGKQLIIAILANDGITMKLATLAVVSIFYPLMAFVD